MIASVHNRTSRVAVKRRRQEVCERLAAFGLMRSPFRLQRSAPAESAEDSRASRLRLCLESLGPVFYGFGLYLSSRFDLLPAQSCYELATISGSTPGMTASSVRALMLEEIGRAPEAAYIDFREEPFETGLMTQSHLARLKDGREVVVKLVNANAEEYLLHDTELLTLLWPAFSGGMCGELAFESAAADFANLLRRQIDLNQEARDLELLAQDAEEFEMLRVPAVHRELCTSRVLTTESLSGQSLTDVIIALNETENQRGAARVADFAVGLDELARMLCLLWLRQSLLGKVFPVEPRPSNILVLPSRQLAFTGGLFTNLPAEAKTNLWNYLVAVSTENPDRACSCLLREMRRDVPNDREDELRRRFKQIVPFRDGEWGGSDGNNLYGHLLSEWRMMSRYGYLPQPYLPSFFRGLFNVVGIAQALAPDGDPLSEGMQDMRLIACLGQFQEMMDLRQMGDRMDKYAAMMASLPQRFNEALTLAAEGQMRLQLSANKGVRARGRKNSSAIVTALIMALAATALCVRYFAATAPASAGRVSLTVFVLLGVWLLWSVGRIR